MTLHFKNMHFGLYSERGNFILLESRSQNPRKVWRLKNSGVCSPKGHLFSCWLECINKDMKWNDILRQNQFKMYTFVHKCVDKCVFAIKQTNKKTPTSPSNWIFRQILFLNNHWCQLVVKGGFKGSSQGATSVRNTSSHGFMDPNWPGGVLDPGPRTPTLKGGKA